LSGFAVAATVRPRWTTFIAIHRKFTAHRGSPLSAETRFSLVFIVFLRFTKI
jgi:hypothetical protein